MRVLVTLNSNVLAKPDIGNGSQHNPYQILGDGTEPTKTSWDGPIATGFASGSGSEEDPYMVESIEQLAYFAKTVNEGNSYEEQYIQLGASIEYGYGDVYSWVPIGNEYNPFSGNFYGADNAIKQLAINDESSNYQGLFGVIDGGSVAALSLEAVEIRGNNNVGAICGAAYSSLISSCLVRSSTILGNEKVGAIVGSAYNGSYINANYVESGTNVSAQNYVGGFVGYLQTSSTISNSYMQDTYVISSYGDCAGLCCGYAGTETYLLLLDINMSQLIINNTNSDLTIYGYEEGADIDRVYIDGEQIN